MAIRPDEHIAGAAELIEEHFLVIHCVAADFGGAAATRPGRPRTDCFSAGLKAARDDAPAIVRARLDDVDLVSPRGPCSVDQSLPATGCQANACGCDDRSSILSVAPRGGSQMGHPSAPSLARTPCICP